MKIIRGVAIATFFGKFLSVSFPCPLPLSDRVCIGTLGGEGEDSAAAKLDLATLSGAYHYAKMPSMFTKLTGRNDFCKFLWKEHVLHVSALAAILWNSVWSWALGRSGRLDNRPSDN